MFHIRGYKSTNTKYLERMGYDGQAAAAVIRKCDVSYNTMSAMQIKAAKLLLQHGVFVFVFL